MLKICIAQLIKNEHRYIEEWIDYHLNLGISKFILFEDFVSESHNDILNKYGDKVILHRLKDVMTVEDCDERYGLKYGLRQPIAWYCFYRLYGNKFDACLFIDPDEYINCSKKEFIYEVIKYKFNENVWAIYYHWHTLTANGHIRDPYPNQKYSIVNTYKEYLKGYNFWSTDSNNNECYNLLGKPLIYLNKIPGAYVYNVPHWIDNLIDSQYRLNHYLTKSWDEYKDRIFNKGEQTLKWGRHIEDFFKINKDLIPYKDELLKECENLQHQFNSENEEYNYKNYLA